MSSSLSKMVSVFSAWAFSEIPFGLGMHVPVKCGTQYQTEAQQKAKMKQSMSLCHFLVQILPLKAFTLEFTLMKNGPRRPLMTPRMMPPGST